MIHPPDKEAEDAPDGELLDAVRAGNQSAYGVLYERHLGVARRAAASLVASRAEQEDVIAEAFTLVLSALRGGYGPRSEFQPYLVVTIRNLVIAARRRTRATLPLDDVPDRVLAGATPDLVDCLAVAEAFLRLPSRWRWVLWRTEIEGESSTSLAHQLGLSPDGAAALACRARKGLRQAYLATPRPAGRQGRCRTTRAQLTA